MISFSLDIFGGSADWSYSLQILFLKRQGFLEQGEGMRYSLMPMVKTISTDAQWLKQKQDFCNNSKQFVSSLLWSYFTYYSFSVSFFLNLKFQSFIVALSVRCWNVFILKALAISWVGSERIASTGFASCQKINAKATKQNKTIIQLNSCRSFQKK